MYHPAYPYSNVPVCLFSGKNGSESSVVDVGCGSRHTVCLTLGNNLWSFGWNKYGQLGLGDTKPRDQVCKVPLPKSINRLVNLQLTGKVQLILIIKNS